MISRDLVCIGAAALSSQELVRILTRNRLDDAALLDATRALTLLGPARDAALLSSPAGPELLAAIELGRRAWMLPPPTGRRVRSPVDVAAIAAPRMEANDARALVIALDLRLQLARIEFVECAPGAMLRSALVGGASRFVVAVRKASPASPTTDDAERMRRLSEIAQEIGVPLVDAVVLGDDGFASLLRLGVIAQGDARYR
jgi:DNA repair protein RadC